MYCASVEPARPSGSHSLLEVDVRIHGARHDESAMPKTTLTPRELTLHGHEVTYRTAGRGPVLVLLHGIANSSQTWEQVAPRLSGRFTLIAPDLLGHGESATPRGDYSLGAHASGVRDLLTALGHERATVVGHSLGGGIAMQFAYQFPERCERLVLVSSGGLGREVHLLLRAAALPGADYVLPLLTSPQLLGAGRRLGGLLQRVRLAPDGDLEVLARGFASLDNTGSRQAFLHTVRAVIEPSGQRVSAHDRLALAALIPTLIVWGERDSIIPVTHGTAAHEAMPGSRLEVFPGAGHMPHDADPDRFAAILTDFCDTTEGARLTADHWQPLLGDETSARRAADP
jgi:pimeloyl-ACP methyl ester carboxylesterase